MNQKGVKMVLIGVVVILLCVGGYFMMTKKTVKIVPEMKLTLDALKNTEYYSVDTGKQIKLVNGEYPLKPLTGESQAEYFIKLDNEHMAFGDLNGDGQEDAVVILVSRSGGSGTYRSLEVVINQNGNPVYVANESLGDRTTVNSIAIQNGLILVNITPWNGGNGLPETINYKLVGDKFVRDSSTTSQVNISNWKMYTNSKYGFEMKIPPNLTPTNKNGLDVVDFISPETVALEGEIPGPILADITFALLKESESSLNNKSYAKDFITKIEKKVTNGVEFTSYLDTGTQADNYVYQTVHGDSLYSFVVHSQNNVLILEKILSTFKFTNSSVSTESTIVQVYFTRTGDESAECDETGSVLRTIPKTVKVGTAALEELLKGPTTEEKTNRYTTNIPSGSKLNSLVITNGEARADFNAITESGGGSCSMAARTNQIRRTLLQFPTIKTVVFSIDGRTEDIFQP